MRAIRLFVAAAAIFCLTAASAGATHTGDQSSNMDEIFESPNRATNSDLAFWGDHAFVGYYTGDQQSRAGVRIFDISDPAKPRLVKNVKCDGLQADPIVWDRDGNGVADLLLLAVDRTMASPECGADRTAHGDPRGWEGVRVFELSDDPKKPFKRVEQVAAVYTDCGAHTITAWPGAVDAGRLVVYVSSYPLRPGPTCGDTEFQNTANPYDGDPGSPANPRHGVIQVLEIPLDDPSESREIAQPALSYPGDPDNQIDWCERNLCGATLEPAAVACHDIVVHMTHNIAGGACAEQGQVWEIDANGIPNTAEPMTIADDEFSSGGTGEFPGAVDFFHSVMFDTEGEVINWVDESFGSGCPTMNDWQARGWHPAATMKTGRIFFSDLGGNFLSEFHVGDLRPDPGATEYCSAHMGMSLLGVEDDLLVNAWYTGGVDVIDFTDASNPQEIAFYDPSRDTGTWSAYPYTGPLFRDGDGIPIYASDGVENNTHARGMVVYRWTGIPVPTQTFDHLNPQTME